MKFLCRYSNFFVTTPPIHPSCSEVVPPQPSLVISLGQLLSGHALITSMHHRGEGERTGRRRTHRAKAATVSAGHARVSLACCLCNLDTCEGSKTDYTAE